MSFNTWNQTLIPAADVDGTPIANTTTDTSLLATALAGFRFLKPANFFVNTGMKLRVLMGGQMNTLATTPGTLTPSFRIGSVAVWSGGAMALNVTAQTNASWWLELDLTLRVKGAAAQFHGIGRFFSRAVIGSAAAAAGGVGMLVLPDTAPTLGTAFDDTASNYMEPFMQWSVANASNSTQLESYEMILAN